MKGLHFMGVFLFASGHEKSPNQYKLVGALYHLEI